MAHAISRSLVPIIALLFAVRSAAALPNALFISETSQCRVSLTKLSYDGPGADDQEFVELFVEGFGGGPGRAPPGPADSGPKAPPCNAQHPSTDSGIRATDGAPPSEAGSDGASGKPTLGDCGLGELRLVNGGAGACDEYRTIPLDAVRVPQDGYVILCAQDSAFSSRCDVNTAGRSALRNGFLQNGPSDGLRFVAVAGAVSLEVSYEGIPACFSPDARRMVDEAGEAAGAPGVDDVNVVCGDRFELMPATEAPFRAPNSCRTPQHGFSGDASPTSDAAWASPGAIAASPEFAPDSGFSYPGFSVPDAAVMTPPKVKSSPTDPPACGTSRIHRTGGGRIPMAFAFWAVLRRRKLRRPRVAPRADCFARSETGLRR